jgi:hypothetical protein
MIRLGFFVGVKGRKFSDSPDPRPQTSRDDFGAHRSPTLTSGSRHPRLPASTADSRALTPLLSTRFGGRKLIRTAGRTSERSALACRPACTRSVTMSPGTPPLPLRGNDRAARQTPSSRRGFHPARGEYGRAAQAALGRASDRKISRAVQPRATGERARTTPHDAKRRCTTRRPSGRNRLRTTMPEVVA